MQFRILGPVEVHTRDGRVLTLPRRQERCLLAILLLEAGRVVPTNRLCSLLWEDNPPDQARQILRSLASRIRTTLTQAGGDDEPVALVSDRGGYRLTVPPDTVDVHRFRHLLDTAADTTDMRQREGILHEALTLWRGPALHNAANDALRQRLCADLDELHLYAVEESVGVGLDLGRHRELIPELGRLTGEHPLRERLVGQYMLALHRAGRTPDALDLYTRTRAHLAGQLGLDPGPDLQQLHETILRGNSRPPTPTAQPPVPAVPAQVPPDVAAPALRPTPPVPAQLPPDVHAFTGRTSALHQLDAICAMAGEQATAVVITALSGTAGVGKTALATHWAQRVSDRFPDGQLYINLRGYAPGPPLSPIAALSSFLRALGVPAEQVPLDVEEAAALYRSALADKRMLVLLDNANHPDQVRPLLPGSGRSLVLVTSRTQLAGLVARDGAHRLMLDVLPPDEAHALLTRILDPGRLEAEPEATAELARLCGHLPLALRIAAANLAANGAHHTIAGYVAELRAGDRLAALQVEGDEQAAVRVAFDQSYASQPPAARRLFRLLSLVPGGDLTADSAAALVGTAPAEAARLLSRLADVHLIEQQTTGRYTVHDLLRLLARHHLHAEESAPECKAAFDRLIAYYFRTADAAARVISPQVIRLPDPDGIALDLDGHTFRDHAGAMAWLEAERSNLVAAITYTAENGPRWWAWYLCDTLRGYFYLRMHLIDWLTAGRAALAAARADGDLNGQAAAHNALGNAHWRHSQFTPALRHFTRAQALARRTGWQECQASVLSNRSAIHRLNGHLRHAVSDLTEALALNRLGDSLRGQVVNLSGLGTVYAELGELAKSARHSTEAIKLHRTIGSTSGEAIDLTNLGEVTHWLGQSQDALRQLDQALALHRRLGNWNTEAETLRILAAVQRDLGHRRQAQELVDAALTLADRSNYRRLRADILNTAGTIELALGRTANAVDRHEQAILLSHRERYPQANALIGLARAHAHTGRPETALRYARQAIALTRRVGYRLLEGLAQAALADALQARGDDAASTTATQQALAVFQETGYAAQWWQAPS